MRKTKIKKYKYFLATALLVVAVVPLYSLSAEDASGQATSAYQQLKDDIAQKEAEIKELEKQAAAYRELIKTKVQEKNSLSRELSILNAEIKKISTEIQLTKGKIDVTKDKIAGLKLAIEEQEGKIAEKYCAALCRGE